MRLTPAEERFYHERKELQELSLFTTSKYDLESKDAVSDDKEERNIEELGAVGVGDNYDNTQELKVVKFKDAMASKDKEGWMKAVTTEHDKFTKYKVWEPVNREDVPKDAKVLTTTWAIKKKSNGTFRARMKARGLSRLMEDTMTEKTHQHQG